MRWAYLGPGPLVRPHRRKSFIVSPFSKGPSVRGVEEAAAEAATPVCPRCPRPGVPLALGAYVDVGGTVLCAQCYATYGAALTAPGATVEHFAVEATASGIGRAPLRAAADVPAAAYVASLEARLEACLERWVRLRDECTERKTDLLSGRLQLSIAAARGAIPAAGWLPQSLSHLKRGEFREKYVRAKALYDETRPGA